MLWFTLLNVKALSRQFCHEYLIQLCRIKALFHSDGQLTNLSVFTVLAPPPSNALTPPPPSNCGAAHPYNVSIEYKSQYCIYWIHIYASLYWVMTTNLVQKIATKALKLIFQKSSARDLLLRDIITFFVNTGGKPTHPNII